ncbi:unnamed protein product [Heligmosomoides polygyrus]|uniref:HTH_7 domain-containing protein n=1 Tax=Heligmosomoides polygyrus TaxID=6339 RepID=A0A3P7ZW70_HELPZ|nr:unnamed protein product [Heligmosomoides polygyrus]
MSRESERITVVELHKTGMRTADIVRTTGFKQRTVYKIVRRYKETGGTSDRPRSGRPTTATTPENINKVEQIDVDSWEHERTHISKTFAPANVLMTNDSLRCRPQMFVGSGGKSQDRDRDTRALQWGDSGDIPGTSSGSQRVPGMKSMFKMYGEVALRKDPLANITYQRFISNGTVQLSVISVMVL